MDGQLSRKDAVVLASFLDELAGQSSIFPEGDHPAHDVPAVDVQDHVQIVIGPLDRAAQLGDVPGPNLVGPRGQQFRRRIGCMGALLASLSDLVTLAQ